MGGGGEKGSKAWGGRFWKIGMRTFIQVRKRNTDTPYCGRRIDYNEINEQEERKFNQIFRREGKLPL